MEIARKSSQIAGGDGGSVEWGEFMRAAGEGRADGGQPAAADFGLLTFKREEGSGEWNYPWDLTGGLYRCA